MRLISHEKLCSTLRRALGIKERQKKLANFRKDMLRKDQRDLGCFEKGQWWCGSFSGWNLLDGHTCQLVIRGIMT
jgi:hypothetical protein